MIKENFIKDYIQTSLKKYWDFPAYTDYEKETYYYKDVARKIARLHLMFDQCNVNQGDKIALLGKNSSSWAMTYLAIVSYGAVVVPLLADFHPNEIHHITNHSEAIAMFVADRLWENIDESKMPNLRAIISLDSNKILIESNKENVSEKLEKLDKLFFDKYGENFNPNSIEFIDIGNERLISLSYTAGSTGFSKGVMLQANSLAANIKFARNNMRLDPGDRLVSILPLAHTFGCSFDFLWPFTRGVNVNFLTRMPTPKILLDAYQKIKPNIILSVPLIIEKVYKSKILPQISKGTIKTALKIPGVKNLIYKKIKKGLTEAFGGEFREIVLGGAPLSQEASDFFRLINFNVTIGYGMTECGPLISYASWDKNRVGSCGKLVDVLEIKIDSEDPFNIEGEIMVRGESVMNGYYKNEEETKKVIDDEGWLHTGDLGVIDNDDFIYIKGRSKSMILGASGENIYPEEIEAIINNKNYVLESLVVSKEKKLVALVHPDFERIDKEKISEDELLVILENVKKDVNKSFAKYKQIAKIELFPSEFEKTPKKNIKRYLYQV
ncbi:MAG: AMP-binding protein [Bacteroidota bacterium]|nr:AMP-binding protein [Bacteroidota bacterium]